MRDPNAAVPYFPLCLNRCNECWHAQLSWNVDRQGIFDDYAYVSGTSKTLNQFFAWFADALKQSIGASKRVLEIAANDGSLIRALQSQGFTCVGVDPARNIVEQARKNGLPLQLGYWPAAAQQVEGEFDAIIGMNVLAHVDDPLAFLQGCRNKLAPGGVVVIQPSQARMIENGEFDTIYHEHISFFNSRSIGRLAARAGLKLVGTALVKVHGDSPVYFLQHAEEASPSPVFAPFARGDFGIAEDLQAYELRVNLFDVETYSRFAAAANQVIEGVKNVVAEHKAAGFQVAFVGAAAKAITLLNAAKIKPDHLLDEAPLKIGLYAPGCTTLVEPLTAATSWETPTLFILSAWNFRFELANKLAANGVPAGSKFYAYFPQEQWITV
jgi:SAM-dependent methyltransferase